MALAFRFRQKKGDSYYFHHNEGDKYNVPRIIFSNKMDKVGANFYQCVDDVDKRLGANPLVINLPIGSENDFAGVIDLIKMKAITWDSDDLGATFNESEIPADMKADAEKWRAKMVGMAVDMEDQATEDYLEGREISMSTLKRCIRKGTLTGKFVPMLCGSSFKNKGVQTLLDAVVDFLPSPLDIGAVKGKKIDSDEEDSRQPEDTAPFSALAFKIMNDPFVGSLTFARIYSGKLESGSYVINSVKEKKERIGVCCKCTQTNVKKLKKRLLVILLLWLV